eukprot:2666699-Pyramimonas_sp.AAC.1
MVPKASAAAKSRSRRNLNHYRCHHHRPVAILIRTVILKASYSASQSSPSASASSWAKTQ